MQLGTTAIPLLPAVAVGVAVVLAGLVLWGVRRVRRAPAPAETAADRADAAEPFPSALDWTGEAAGGAADPPRPRRPATVADAVAARRAETQALAAVAADPDGSARRQPSTYPGDDEPVTGPARTGLHRATEDGPDDLGPSGRWVPRHSIGMDLGSECGSDDAVSSGDAAVRGEAESPTAEPDRLSPVEIRSPGERVRESEPTAASDAASPGLAPVRADAGPPISQPDRSSRPESSSPGEPPVRTERVAAADAATSEPEESGAASADPARPGAASALPDGVFPELAEDADGLDAVATTPVPPPWSPARGVPGAGPGAGPSEPVSFAVQQALAARAVQRARTCPDAPDAPDTKAVDPPCAVPDVRDRLLSVLLSDPAAALGAATDLDENRERIDRLGDVLRRRRADFATAVQRLHASGLTGEQIGRLADLDGDDVRAILEQPTGDR